MTNYNPSDRVGGEMSFSCLQKWLPQIQHDESVWTLDRLQEASNNVSCFGIDWQAKIALGKLVGQVELKNMNSPALWT